ncbi:MAG: glycosyltransferase family 4 protein [Candidatus Sumerlaeaceae bacterium]|jgi:glycosyltransferase involved in cell wall biosynthesis
MSDLMRRSSDRLHKIVLIGNYLPRQCGIATFTTDLLTSLASEAHDSEVCAVVMNDIPEGYDYPPEVRFEINQKKLSDYRLAADFLNMSQVDVVCLQHEYGIFGGESGAYILELLAHLRMPVVSTLHTVLQQPTPSQRHVLRSICQHSDRVVVMSNRAVELLQEIYDVPRDKIVMIGHGIPDVPFVDPNFYKDQFCVEGRKVMLTFGLLSPGKGIEYMIEALPEIVAAHPDVVYIVLGATHPHIKRQSGESYRMSLLRRARELGVDSHLIFHNRFVELSDLCEFLGAADVYVTPYINKEQIVSGTLAYALGAGKAVVSTPYWYAEEMLAEGRGRLVGFCDSKSLAEQIIDLLTNEVERHAMRKRAYTFTRDMVWKEVARKYLHVFHVVKCERASKPRPHFHTRTAEVPPHEMPPVKLDHVLRLTDDVGILQHAKFAVPDRYHGYCTDDNARALITVLQAQEILTEPLPGGRRIEELAYLYLSFLHYAFNEETGRFRNFMAYDRRWLEEVGAEDCHGRAVCGLGVAIGLSHSDHLVGAAMPIFEKALAAVEQFTSPRAWAFGLIGAHAYLNRYSGDSEVRRICDRLASRLFALWRDHADEHWCWPEPYVTYENARIPQALILAGRTLDSSEMVSAGIKCLEWLARLQLDERGHFVPIGNRGWYARGAERARFDQQPVEAQAMIEACRAAYVATLDKKWSDYAQLCLDWFLGRNDLSVPLYDEVTGGCCDGLTPNGPNRNQGAESTLAWLLTLLNAYEMNSLQVAADTSAPAHATLSS